MIGDAFQYAGKTSTADALLAGNGDFYTVALQYLNHRFVRRHLEDLPRAAQLDGKTAIRAGIHRGCREVFTMQIFFSLALSYGAIQYMLHETARAAGIEMLTRLWISQDCGDIQNRIEM